MLLQSVLTRLIELMRYDKLHNKYSESVVVLLGCLDSADFTYDLKTREPLPYNLNNGYRPYEKITFAFANGDERINDEVVLAFSEAGFKWTTTKEGSLASYCF